jgi:hypothetical protein
MFFSFLQLSENDILNSGISKFIVKIMYRLFFHLFKKNMLTNLYELLKKKKSFSTKTGTVYRVFEVFEESEKK